MEKVGTTGSKLTRGDKIHKKLMDKYEVYKDGFMHGLNSLTTIHKQTLDSADKYAETISKSQEPERSALIEIIRTSEDETRRKEAWNRLEELDLIKEKQIDTHYKFIQIEGDKENKNIMANILLLAAAGGLISSKQVRQMSGKALTTISKNLPRIRG